MKLHMADVLKFQAFYSQIREKQIPLKIAYKLNKLNLTMEKEAEFYQSKFNEIVDKYAMRDDKGQYIMNDEVSVKIKEDKLDDCQKAMNELQNLEVAIDPIMFTLEDLESLEIGIGAMQALMPFIEE